MIGIQLISESFNTIDQERKLKMVLSLILIKIMQLIFHVIMILPNKLFAITTLQII